MASSDFERYAPRPDFLPVKSTATSPSFERTTRIISFLGCISPVATHFRNGIFFCRANGHHLFYIILFLRKNQSRPVLHRIPLIRYQRSGSGRCPFRSEEHTSELQSRENLVCRLLL